MEGTRCQVTRLMRKLDRLQLFPINIEPFNGDYLLPRIYLMQGNDINKRK